MLLVLLAGCAEPDAADNQRPDNAAPIDTAADVTPESGKWVYETISISSARCQALEEILPFAVGADFKIFQVDERGFNSRLPDIETSTRCDLNGEGFTCEPLRGTTSVDDYDIALVSELDAQGRFEDSTLARGRYALEVDCEGSVCGAAAVYYGVGFPCELEVGFVARFE